MSDGEVIGVVFDIPTEPWVSEIMRLRKKYDPSRAQFPVEITVAGSSGLGWIVPSQGYESVKERLRAIAQTTPPLCCAFSQVEEFPVSQTYYLSLLDEEPFHAFQQRLAASSIQFGPVAFSYKPHCTIVQLTDSSPDSAKTEISAFPVPVHRITIASLSTYAVANSHNACRLVDSWPLG